MCAMVRWCPPFLAAAILVFAFTSGFRGEEADAADNKAGDKKISAVVKTVINRGADMFNMYRDYAGCYRYYQGALTALEAMLEHHPDLQKAIRDGLAEAERTPAVTQRAFVLRRTLGTIWEKFNPQRAKPAKDKGTADKPDVDRRPEDKPPADKPTADKKPVDKPAADKKPTDKPAADKKPADKPATDKKPTDKPAADKKPADKPEKDKKPDDKPSKDVPKDLSKDVKKDDKPTDKPTTDKPSTDPGKIQ